MEGWLFLFFMGLLLLNWPFLKVFKAVLPYYLFVVWVLLVVAVALMSRGAGKGRS